MKNGHHSVATAAEVFDYCYHFACDFPISTFEHCNREANKVAHQLARLARFSLTFDWFEEPLNEVVPFLVLEICPRGNNI